MDLPDTIKEQFEQLSYALTHAHTRWRIYKQLYVEEPEKRIKLLNRMAPAFFGVLQHTLIDHVIMSIGRMADRTETAGQANLCIERLVSSLGESETETDELFLGTVRDKAQIFEENARLFKQHRHKRIAHSDLEVSLKIAAEPLPGVTPAMVDTTLAAAAAVLNEVQSHYDSSETMYEHVTMQGDASSIVHRLREALAYERHARIGTIPAWIIETDDPAIAESEPE